MHFNLNGNEYEWIRKAQRGDNASTQALLNHYHGFLRHAAYRVSPIYVLQDELIQAGYLGMLKALQRFDVGQKVRFLTYALPWILGEMKRVIRQFEYCQSFVSFEADGKDNVLPLVETMRGSEDIDYAKLDLHLAIQKLSKEEQLLISLRYFRDKSQTECAVLLNKSQTQISRIECRAIEKLHTMLT